VDEVLRRLGAACALACGVVSACAAEPMVLPTDAAIVRRDANLDAWAAPPRRYPAAYCASPADCDDGLVCTEDRCETTSWTSFQGQCAHVRLDACVEPPDAGPPDAGRRDAGPVRDASTPIVPVDPVDPACGGGASLEPVFLPFVSLGALGLPADCAMGFEWQNCTGTAFARATPASGSAGGTLVVDLATYTQPDRLRITGRDADGAIYVLLDTCRVRTLERGDPTDGRTRPPDEAIRRFRLEVRPGTRSLTFDAGEAFSPWYMRVLGLCDFAWEPASPECVLAFRDASG
jgi:hypothetical protein